jgi:MFS family permease
VADIAAAPPLRRFLIVYGLAWAGVAIAYLPFLTILLPIRVTDLAGPDQGIAWVARISFGGALAASVGHILFGWLSDISGVRRPWALAGLLLSSVLLLLVPKAGGLPALMAIIVAWQLALNMMMAPLAALAGDVVPDAHKGMLGGLMALAPGGGALAGMLITWPGLAGPDLRLVLVVALVAACVAPILLLRLPALVDAPAAAATPTASPAGSARRMWWARLAVQIAEAALFAYLYLWFRSVDGRMTDNRVASLFAIILLVSAPLSLLAGRWSDRRGRPFAPLRLLALASALGLLVMALAGGALIGAVLGFGLFALASAGFLALHSAQTLRVLRRPGRRGRDLGLFNLTNTIPSLIMPWLTLGVMPQFGFAGLFLVLALLCVAGALILSPRRG